MLLSCITFTLFTRHLRRGHICPVYFSLFVWILWHINVCGLLNARFIFKQTLLSYEKKTCELGFLETVKLLSELFSSKTALFHKKWKCLNLTKRDSDDYLGFASVINKSCDDFKLGELSADNFKCLIFAQGLVSAKYTEIRRRVLSKLENEPDLTLQKLAEDSQRIVSVRKD